MARVCVLVMIGFALAGCMNGPGGGLFAARPGAASAHAPSQVQVMSKGFTVAGPKGFCIDRDAMREDAEGAFVVLGSCAAISGNPRDAKPSHPALLTASVTPASAPLDAEAFDRMVAFFSTEPGRIALARSDNASEVTVVDLFRDDGLVLVHAEDGDRTGDVAGDYWRAVFQAAGHLVTVTVSGFREHALDAEAGEELARRFVGAIRSENGDPRPDPDVAPNTPLEGAGARLASFFNRLL